LRSNPHDASAHYLLGTLAFSRGLAQDAINEWEEARKLNPNIQVLHASLGRALLHMKNDPQQALDVFQEGLRSDPLNVELYTGMDQTLSILGRPAQERVAALERYPDRATMPSHLLYELILNLAEAGGYDRALALFRNRFFEREEGGTNVREVWLEVELQRASSLALQGKCSDAVSVADHLGNPVPNLPFTQDGVEAFLRSARINYLLGNLYQSCKLSDKANARFKHAAQQSDLEDGVWAWKASQAMGDVQQKAGQQKLENLLQRTRNIGETSARSGSWLYNIAILDRAIGKTEQADTELRKALLFPDERLSYHLTRLALSDNYR
jgi:tetratricopeptide (TPR) repeat protein